MPSTNGLTPAQLAALARRDCAEEIRRVLRVVGGPVSRAELLIILGDTYAEPVIDAAISDVRRERRPCFPIHLGVCGCRSCRVCFPMQWRC